MAYSHEQGNLQMLMLNWLRIWCLQELNDCMRGC
jgi:hypothetical protein